MSLTIEDFSAYFFDEAGIKFHAELSWQQKYSRVVGDIYEDQYGFTQMQWNRIYEGHHFLTAQFKNSSDLGIRIIGIRFLAKDYIVEEQVFERSKIIMGEDEVRAYSETIIKEGVL